MSDASDHTTALVPVDCWSYNAPDLRARGVKADLGLLSEALLYYDRLLVSAGNVKAFTELLQWFDRQGCSADLLSLVADGTITFYDYGFLTTTVKNERDGDVSIWNVQDPVQEAYGTFPRRILYPAVSNVIASSRLRQRFYKIIPDHVIETKSDTFGPAIYAAKVDSADERRLSIVVQAFVDELFRTTQGGRPPEMKVEVIGDPSGARYHVRFTPNLLELVRARAPLLDFHETTPLIGAAVCNRDLLSAARRKCDLYLPRPMSTLAGDKLYETVSGPTHLGRIVEELEHKVEFPDIRSLVNAGQLGISEVLELRRKARQFRTWVQAEADRDRDAIAAYHHEVARESGLTRAARRVVRMIAVSGGAAAGTALGVSLSGPLGAVSGAAVGASLGAAAQHLVELVSGLREGWKPMVFGDWMRGRIEKYVEDHQTRWCSDRR
jgi:hypothetical protein